MNNYTGRNNAVSKTGGVEMDNKIKYRAEYDDVKAEVDKVIEDLHEVMYDYEETLLETEIKLKRIGAFTTIEPEIQKIITDIENHRRDDADLFNKLMAFDY